MKKAAQKSPLEIDLRSRLEPEQLARRFWQCRHVGSGRATKSSLFDSEIFARVLGEFRGFASGRHYPPDARHRTVKSSGEQMEIRLASCLNLPWGWLKRQFLTRQSLKSCAQWKLLKRLFWSLGITGIHDYDQRGCFMALQEMEQAGGLGLRVVKGIPHEDFDHAVALGLRTGFGSDFLRIGSLKMFADGALAEHCRHVPALRG